MVTGGLTRPHSTLLGYISPDRVSPKRQKRTMQYTSGLGAYAIPQTIDQVNDLHGQSLPGAPAGSALRFVHKWSHVCRMSIQLLFAAIPITALAFGHSPTVNRDRRLFMLGSVTVD